MSSVRSHGHRHGRGWRAVGRAMASVSILLWTGCHGSHGPAPAALIPTVVPGPGAQYDEIDVTAGTMRAVIPADLRTHLAPLIAARVLPPPPLPDYGLDRPEGQLVYLKAARTVATVDLGSPDFDHRSIYASRPGDPQVYLLAADSLRPVLALVGVVVPAATD